MPSGNVKLVGKLMDGKLPNLKAGKDNIPLGNVISLKLSSNLDKASIDISGKEHSANNSLPLSANSVKKPRKSTNSDNPCKLISGNDISGMSRSGVSGVSMLGNLDITIIGSIISGKLDICSCAAAMPSCCSAMASVSASCPVFSSASAFLSSYCPYIANILLTGLLYFSSKAMT